MTAARAIRLFLSSVTTEFGSWRARLAGDLHVPLTIEVIEQDQLVPTGTDTLLKLDDHIQRCDWIVHFVGDRIGGLPKRQEVPDLLARHPDLPSKLGLEDSTVNALTRTQWEAWLALYHGKMLFVLEPSGEVPRDPPPVDPPEPELPAEQQRALQQQHMRRLAARNGKDKIVFDSYPVLLKRLNAALHFEARGAQPADVPALDPVALNHLHALRGRVRDDPAAMPLDDAALGTIDNLHPLTIEQYHLQQIARWSRKVYRIDRRFTPLALRLNVEDEKVDKSYQDMRDILRFLETKQHPAITVFGPPGAGKSTLLRRLGYDCAVDAVRAPVADARIPFYLELRSLELTPQCATPRAWLAAQWNGSRFRHLGAFDALFDAGRFLLLLDAVNEMPCEAGEYDKLLARWSEFLAPGQLPVGNQVVFSCRRLDYSVGLQIEKKTIPHAEVESLGPERIREFLGLYLEGREDLARETYARLEAEDSFELYNSPFYLTLLVDLVKDGAAVPRGRAALFCAFIRKALQRESKTNRLFAREGELLSADDFDQVRDAAWAGDHDLPMDSALFTDLAALAHHMQTLGEAGDLARRRVLRLRLADVHRFLQDRHGGATGPTADDSAAKTLIKAACDLHLLERDSRTRELQFRHQLFQEYFAARQLVTYLTEARPGGADGRAMTVAERAHQPWRAIDIHPSVEEELARGSMAERLPALAPTGWEETLKLALAQLPAPALLVRALADTNLPLAGVGAASSEVKARLDAALLDSLRARLLERSRDTATDLRARIAAGLALGELGDPRLTPLVPPGEERPGTCALVPEFATIAAGQYPAGVALEKIPENERKWFEDATPTHIRVEKPFELARLPVTNAEWARFMIADGYNDVRWWRMEAARVWREGTGTGEAKRQNWHMWRDRALGKRTDFSVEELRLRGNEDDYRRVKGWAALDDAAFEALLREQAPDQTFREPAFWRNPAYNAPAQPVVGVCWHEAQAYCEWLTAQAAEAGLRQRFRLPTESEWEAAAGGVNGRDYAWDGAWSAARCNVPDTRIKTTAPAGVFPGGDTPEGVSDLSGNVFEWTSTLYRPAIDGVDDGREDPELDLGEDGKPLARVVRGGSWSNGAVDARVAYRSSFVPGDRDDDQGFRLVRVSHP